MVATQSLMMMRLIVLAKKEHRHRISDVTTGSVPTGIGNVIGNKGGLGIAFKFIETSLCFVGSHLAARCDSILLYMMLEPHALTRTSCAR
jgi:hypothetical protein